MGRPKKEIPPSVEPFLGSDGDWHAYKTVGVKPDGTPDRVHRQGKSPEAVAEKIRKLDRQLAKGEKVHKGRASRLDAWLRHWYEVECAHLRYKTRKNYRSDCELHIIPLAGSLILDYPSHEPFRKLFATLEANGVEAATRAHVYDTLRAALNIARKLDVLHGPNPLANVTRPTPDDFEIEPYDVDEVRRFLHAAKFNADGTSRRNSARWTVGFALGTRQGESLGFHWTRNKGTRGSRKRRHGDVDLKNGTIRVREQAQRQTYEHGCEDPRACAAAHCRTEPCGGPWQHGCADPRECAKPLCNRKQYPSEVKKGSKPRPCEPGCTKHARACPHRKRGQCKNHNECVCPPDCLGHAMKCPQRQGGIVFVAPKSKAAERSQALPKPLWDELIAHKAAQEAEAELMGEKWEDNELVFCDEFGRPIDPSDDRKEFLEICELAGIDPARVHDIRHTAATILLLLGVDPIVVMNLMGWTQMSMLQRYQHIVDELRRDAAARMAGMIWGPQQTPTPTESLVESNVVNFHAFREQRRA